MQLIAYIGLLGYHTDLTIFFPSPMALNPLESSFLDYLLDGPSKDDAVIRCVVIGIVPFIIHFVLFSSARGIQ